MRVHDVHSRVLPVDLDAAGALIDTLAGPDDRLWPHERWPAMRLDRPLRVGARGGHGPIGYRVEEYVPGRRVRFAFLRPKGLHGYHEWEVEPRGADTVLRHVLAVDTVGVTVLSWPLLWRPLHDALIDDGLEKAGVELGVGCSRTPWSRWVRTLRWMVGRAGVAGSTAGHAAI